MRLMAGCIFLPIYRVKVLVTGRGLEGEREGAERPTLQCRQGQVRESCGGVTRVEALLPQSQRHQSLPHILKLFSDFSCISGYKINWQKSAFLPLCSSGDDLTQLRIPIVNQFKYLGIDIFPTLETTVNNNYNTVFNKIKTDLGKWALRPISFDARISIIKMLVLPQINFLSSMLPLNPQVGYWDKLHSLVTSFIWNSRRPRIKLTTLQRHKTAGGWGVPNFKVYYWSFVLRTVQSWLDSTNSTSWRSLEENLVHPHRLQDLIYAGVPLKQAKLRFGPIIANVLITWKLVTKHTNLETKWHHYTPIFHNYNLLLGGRTLAYPIWSNNGIYLLGQLFNTNGLCTFQELQQQYNLPGFSFFLYLQLRSALKAYGVPWDSELPKCDLTNQLYKTNKTKGTVSMLYSQIMQSSYKPMTIQTTWQNHFSSTSSEISWETVWNNVKLASKNPNHQTIHLRFVLTH